MAREAINNFLFGTVEEEAERELLEYNPSRGKRKKSLGDQIGDFVTGRGAAIDREVEKQYVDKLTNKYGTTLTELGSVPGLDVPTITKNTNADKLKQTIALLTPKYQGIKDARETVGAQGAIVDPTKFTTREAILAEGVRQVEARKEQERQKQRGEARTDLEETRAYQDGLLKETRAYNEGLIERQDLKEERKDIRASLERAENRRLTAETNQMQLQLQYANLDQQQKFRREDRKDKAIMQLIAGLGNLGAAFTI